MIKHEEHHIITILWYFLKLWSFPLRTQSHLTSHFSSFRGCALLFYLSLLAIQFSGYWHEFTRFSGINLGIHSILLLISQFMWTDLSSQAPLSSHEFGVSAQALLIWHQSNESCVASWSTAVFFSSPHLLHLYTYTWLIFRLSLIHISEPTRPY